MSDSAQAAADSTVEGNPQMSQPTESSDDDQELLDEIEHDYGADEVPVHVEDAPAHGPFQIGPEDPGHYLPQQDWDAVVARAEELQADPEGEPS